MPGSAGSLDKPAMFGSLLLLGLLRPAHAQPIVVTDFRANARDASVSYMLYNELIEELDRAGFSVVDGEQVWNRLQVNPMECGASPSCRRDALEAFDSPLAVVGESQIDGSTVVVTVRFYGWERPNPVEVYQEWIDPGQEPRVVREIVDLADDLHARLPMPRGGAESSRERESSSAKEDRRREEEDRRREDDRRASERELDREDEYLDEVLSLDDELGYEDELDRGRDSRGDAGRGAAARPGNESERSAMGLPDFLYRKYLDSGMGSTEWMVARRVRQRAFSVEVQGGLGRGDTDRSYDVRVALDDATLAAKGVYSYDTLLPGQWPQVMGGIGFNPTPWIEVGVLGGIQYGQKYLTAGWERYDEDNTLVTRDADAYEPVPAVSAVIEPRLRLYPLMVGYFKPFFTLGYNVRIMDDYEVPDLSTVDFPDTPGRVIHGLTVGVGAMIDVHPRIAIVLDVPMTLELAGHEGRMETTPLLSNVPLPCSAEEPPCHWGRLTRFSAGLQIRL